MISRTIPRLQFSNYLVSHVNTKNGFLNVISCSLRIVASGSGGSQRELQDYKDENQTSVIKSATRDIQSVREQTFDLRSISKKPLFPEVIHEKETKVGFWKTEKGLQLKDTIYTGVGRFARVFVSTENYDNHYERALNVESSMLAHHNRFEDKVLKEFGPEFALCFIAFRLGGAVKLALDDRWVDHPKNIRVTSKKDCTVEAIDMRKTSLNYVGMKYFDRAGYVKYLNVADCKYFNNNCMTRLHTLSHTLEYLDISGTAVTPAAFSYLRIFPKLKWINISRLSNEKQVEQILPYIQEIVPHDCVVTNVDKLPSDSYGTKIPYRGQSNPSKDLILDVDPGIGNVETFITKYGYKPSEVNDVSVIHQLWKTPQIHAKRGRMISLHFPKTDSSMKTVVKYLYKAEQYKPLM